MKKKSPTFVQTEDKLYAVNRKARRQALAQRIPAVHVPMPCIIGNKQEGYFLQTAEGALQPFTPPYSPAVVNRSKY